MELVTKEVKPGASGGGIFDENGKLIAQKKIQEFFIYPGYQFKIVDCFNNKLSPSKINIVDACFSII